MRLALGLACAAALTVTVPARAEPPIVGERFNDTAYTLRRNEFSAGLLSEQFGVLNEVTVGTYLVPWLVFPVAKAPIPNAFFKVRDWFFGPAAFAVQGSVLIFDAAALSSSLTGDRPASSGLLVFPVDATASVQFNKHITQSFELTYSFVGVGLDAPNTTSVGGAATASALSASTLFELRLTRVFALTLLAKMLVAQSALHVRADIQSPGLDVNADLGVRAQVRKVLWCVVPGVSFHWSHVGLELGLGYGSNWIPFVELPIGSQTIVPRGDFFVRF